MAALSRGVKRSISKRCTPCEVHNVYSLRVSQFRAKMRNRFQIDAVSPFAQPMKPYRFENAPPLAGFSKRCGFNIGLDRHRVNERRNRIAFDAVTNAFV